MSRTDRETAPAATIERLDLDAYVAAIPGLAELLVDAVDGGAGGQFRRRADHRGRDDLVARPDGAGRRRLDRRRSSRVERIGRIVGSTLLFRATQPNAPHRAEIGKVLVHREARRRGLGRALMEAAEALARAEGRWLLILDTQSGTAAEAMYLALGWQPFGVVPNHSLKTDGVLAPTTFFWKDLR